MSDIVLTAVSTGYAQVAAEDLINEYNNMALAESNNDGVKKMFVKYLMFAYRAGYSHHKILTEGMDSIKDVQTEDSTAETNLPEWQQEGGLKVSPIVDDKP